VSNASAASSQTGAGRVSRPANTGAQVAAIVACYNHAAFVRQSLDSVMSQTIPVQLIIVDDASSDGSQEIIREWVAERGVDAHLVLHETNRGVCRSLNEGARAVRAPYIGFLAADDYWLPGKLARQVRLLEAASTAYGALYGEARLCDASGALLPGSCIAHQSRRRPADRPQGWIFGELMRNNFIPCASTLMRTTAFETTGGFDESLLVEDLDFWLRLSRRYQVVYDDVPSAVYRIQSGSFVRTYGMPRLLLEDLRIYQKYFDDGGADRRLAAAALSRGFYRLFAAGAPVGPSVLWLSLRLKIHWQPALILLPALLGLSGPRYLRLRSWLGRRFPALRRLDL
jgi:glycosyltransferase involved in cell wall biosynthesis